MKLSEFKGDDALELLADIIDPTVEILSDTKISDLVKANGAKTDIVKLILRNHKQSIKEILARMENVAVDDFEINVFTFPVKVLEIINDEDLMAFFTSQVQMTDNGAFGLAMENTTENEA